MKAVLTRQALRMLGRWLLLTTIGLIVVAIVTLAGDVNAWFWGAVGLASLPTAWLLIEVILACLGDPVGEDCSSEVIEVWLNQDPLHSRKTIVEPTGAWRIMCRFTIMEAVGFGLLIAMQLFDSQLFHLEVMKQARLPLTIALVLLPLIYALIAALMLTRENRLRRENSALE